MSGLRTSMALLESATDELTASVWSQALDNATARGHLIGAMQLALVQLRTGKSDLARTTLERALERNRL